MSLAAIAHPPDSTLEPIDQLLLVYDADSGTLNAIIDSAKKLFMIKGCPLCSLTHSMAGERSSWKTCKEEMGVDVQYVHRDEIDAELAPVVEGNLPCVIAKVGSELVMLLDRKALERCRSSVADFRGRLRFHARQHGLSM